MSQIVSMSSSGDSHGRRLELTSLPPLDDTALRAALADLAQLAIDHLDLDEMLAHVAELAVHAIPGADGASITLVHLNKPSTMVANTKFVADIDAIQHGLRESPSTTSIAEQRTISSGSLGGDRAWPRFGPRISRLGIHSVIAVPLVVPAGTIGSLNVYSRGKNAFDRRSVEVAELYATPAAVSVWNAKALARTRNLAAQLQEALTSRAVIDQALGILMSRSGYAADEAFARLRSISQTENRKLAAVAQQVVDEAVRRARARRVDGL